MALCHEWSTAVNADPAILSRSVEDGLSVLGYDSVKPEQLAAIKSVLRGEDVFVSVPTGFGKSLMYQILPICTRKLLRSCGSTLPADLIPVVVVVSPLIALMQDQVSKLNSGCSGDSTRFVYLVCQQPMVQCFRNTLLIYLGVLKLL